MVRLGIASTVVLSLVFCIAAPKSAFALSCGKNSSHNGIFGQRQPGDELLYTNNIKSSSKMMRVVSRDITYPAENNEKPDVITYIELLDKYSDNTGGCANIFSGGVGSAHASIHFKSQRGRGMEFSVHIYGRRKRQW